MSNKLEINSEYIKSHKLDENFDAFHLFTHLVMNAHEKDGELVGFKQTTQINKGQYWVGSQLLLITKAIGFSSDYTMLLLGYLSGLGVIKVELKNLDGYVITVCDYEMFLNSYLVRRNQ